MASAAPRQGLSYGSVSTDGVNRVSYVQQLGTAKLDVFGNRTTRRLSITSLNGGIVSTSDPLCRAESRQKVICTMRDQDLTLNATLGVRGDQVNLVGDVAAKLLGLAGADLLLGGSGDDTLWGGPGADFLAGREGDDTLNGFGQTTGAMGMDGADEIHGNDGADLIYANDGLAEMVRCGLGGDVAFVDVLDTQTSCERNSF